jgi:hypothetical protein
VAIGVLAVATAGCAGSEVGTESDAEAFLVSYEFSDTVAVRGTAVMAPRMERTYA